MRVEEIAHARELVLFLPPWCSNWSTTTVKTIFVTRVCTYYERIFLKSWLDPHSEPLTPLRNLLRMFKSPAPLILKFLWRVSGGWRKRRWCQHSEHSFYEKGWGRAGWSWMRPWWWGSHCHYSPTSGSNYLPSFPRSFDILRPYYINNTTLDVLCIFLLQVYQHLILQKPINFPNRTKQTTEPGVYGRNILLFTPLLILCSKHSLFFFLICFG